MLLNSPLGSSCLTPFLFESLLFASFRLNMCIHVLNRIVPKLKLLWPYPLQEQNAQEGEADKPKLV